MKTWMKVTCNVYFHYIVLYDIISLFISLNSINTVELLL